MQSFAYGHRLQRDIRRDITFAGNGSKSGLARLDLCLAGWNSTRLQVECGGDSGSSSTNSLCHIDFSDAGIKARSRPVGLEHREFPIKISPSNSVNRW